MPLKSGDSLMHLYVPHTSHMNRPIATHQTASHLWRPWYRISKPWEKQSRILYTILITFAC